MPHDRSKRRKEPTSQAPPAPLTYPYVWYPSEPVAPRPRLTDAESAKIKADARREREQRKAARAEEKAKVALERHQHKVRLLEERRLSELEKHPRRAPVLPYDGPPVTLDDLDELDVGAPSSVHLDPELLHTLSEQDDGFIHEDEEEIGVMLVEELNALPAAFSPRLNLNYDYSNLFRRVRRRYLLKEWRKWNRS